MVGFKSDVLPYYNESDILLCTSRFEGFGLTLMESKVCGVPMVCYELPNLDIMRNSKGMIIVEQQDVKAAADAIVKILKDDKYKKALGREARESVEEFYQIELTDIWDNIFKQTLIPNGEKTPLSKLPALETSMRIAVEKYREGIETRFHLTLQTQHFVSRCRELEAILDETNKKYVALDSKYVALDKAYLASDAKYVALDKLYLETDAKYVALDKKYLELDAQCVALDERRAEAEGKYNELAQRLAATEAELASFHSNRSYKIGRIITFFPRKIKALFKRKKA